MDKTKLSPLQQLRLEKRQLKKQYKDEEDRLAQNWEYMTNNVGSLLFNSVIKGAKGIVGVDSKPKNKLPVATPFDQSSGFQAVLSGLTASLPLIWEFAQPMLIGFAVKKFKNLFTKKKKVKE